MAEPINVKNVISGVWQGSVFGSLISCCTATIYGLGLTKF